MNDCDVIEDENPDDEVEGDNNGSIRMAYFNLEPRTIIWNWGTKTWKLREIIQQSNNGTCTQKIKFANMHMSCRPCYIIVE